MVVPRQFYNLKVLEPTSFRKNQTQSQIQPQKSDASNIQISQGHSDHKLQNTPQLAPAQTKISLFGSDKQIPLNLLPGQQPPITSSALSMVKQQDFSRPCSPVEVKVAQNGTHRQMSQPSDLKYTSPVHVPVNRHLSTASFLDDILSSSPDDGKREKAESVLAPKVLTAQDIQQQKEDLLKNSSHENLPIDPYKDKSKLSRFAAEVEKLAKFVEGFEKPLCSGPTPLDIIWKELSDEQEKAMRQQNLSIARCYPMKNRDQDIMPYDNTRVLLTSLKDDYINASWINDLSPSCPKFIATQAPLLVTLIDFWAMVYEQGVEVLVALSSDIEVGKKFPPYLPKEKGEIMDHGSVQLILQSIKQKPLWTERIMHLRHVETKTGRTLVHLHYNSWPISGFPEKVSYILQFITEVHSFYRQQRSFMKPIVVHCGNGVGRTGMFQLIYVGMQVINHGDRIINIPDVAKEMLWKRRNILVKKDHLKFCYEAILYYAQDILAKEGILVHKASFGDQLPKPGAKVQGWEPGQDILFGSMSFTSLQTNVAKLGTRKNNSTSANSNDEKLETLKSDEIREQNKISDKDLQFTHCNENLILKQPFDTSSLPDVVQNQGLNLERKNKESTIVNALCETEVLVDLDSNVTQIKAISQTETVPICNLGCVKSKEDNGSLEYIESAKGSKTVSSMPVNKGPQPGSVSLVELQDPTKFELGTSEGSKKKITKADFFVEKKFEKDLDHTDPFSSLDPLWSVKK